MPASGEARQMLASPNFSIHHVSTNGHGAMGKAKAKAMAMDDHGLIELVVCCALCVCLFL
jgi:hypothetical protein